MKKKLLALCMVFAVMVTFVPFYGTNLTTVSAASSSSDFVIENGILMDYTGSSSVVVIPDTVKIIDYYAFAYYTSLVSVTIPESVETIRPYAFFGCWNLNEITLPSHLKFIGMWAFGQCFRLPEITVPETVEFIGTSAFYCKAPRIHVASGNQYYASKDGILFNKDYSKLICYPVGIEGSSYTIPDTVTAIGNDAFPFGSRMTEITIPTSVKSIGNGAFEECVNLKRVNYNGTEAQWGALKNNIAGNNVPLLRAPLMCRDSVLITTQPADSTAQLGGTVRFSVEAIGDGLTYQWQLSHDDGKTWRNSSVKSANYTATLTAAGVNRQVRCVITNQYGKSATSSAAVMKTSDLMILTQPADRYGQIESTITFRLKAAGEGLAYQWQLSDDQGKTWRNSSVLSADYTTTLNRANDGRYVRCIVTDRNGNSLTTETAVMHLVGVAVIGQLSDCTAKFGGAVSFQVKTVGEVADYQWQLSDDAGKTWRNSSTKTANYATTLNAKNIGRYVRCIVTDQYGNQIPTNAAVMKLSGIAITSQPADSTAKLGGAVSFKVKAVGYGLTYQWQLSDDAGKTWRNSSVKTANYATTLSEKNIGRYVRCLVTDKNGESLTSEAAAMHLVSAAITVQPVDCAATLGSTVSFKVKAVGEGLTYQWQLSDDAGKTWRNSSVKPANYYTTLTGKNDGRYVRCLVTDKNGNSVKSNAAYMKITSSAADTSKTNTGITADANGTVWVTDAGLKYHSTSTCSNMKNPVKVTLEHAKAAGYTPCQKCY